VVELWAAPRAVQQEKIERKGGERVESTIKSESDKKNE
jgi:hypothetical protein